VIFSSREPALLLRAAAIDEAARDLLGEATAKAGREVPRRPALSGRDPQAVVPKLAVYPARLTSGWDARVFDLPDQLPVIAVAARGPVSARIAAELGDGLFATEPDGELVGGWQKLGGSGPVSVRCRSPGRPTRTPLCWPWWRRAGSR
jgi:hypothetical protein